MSLLTDVTLGDVELALRGIVGIAIAQADLDAGDGLVAPLLEAIDLDAQLARELGDGLAAQNAQRDVSLASQAPALPGRQGPLNRRLDRRSGRSATRSFRCADRLHPPDLLLAHGSPHGIRLGFLGSHSRSYRVSRKTGGSSESACFVVHHTHAEE